MSKSYRQLVKEAALEKENGELTAENLKLRTTLEDSSVSEQEPESKPETEKYNQENDDEPIGQSGRIDD